MKYYVIYKEYHEYNQFEGSWDVDFKVFPVLEQAKKFVEQCNKDRDTELMAGPLVVLEE